MTTEVRNRLTPHSAAARALPGVVADALKKVGITPSANDTGRYSTATGVAALAADVLSRTDNVAFIESLANTSLPSTDEAAARSLLNAMSVAGQLQGFNWERLKPLLDAEKQKDARGTDAKAALDRLRAALTTDELAQPIGSALQRAENDVFAWLVEPMPQPPFPPTPTPAPQPKASGKRDVTTKADITWVTADIEAFIDEHDGQSIVVEWRIEP